MSRVYIKKPAKASSKVKQIAFHFVTVVLLSLHVLVYFVMLSDVATNTRTEPVLAQFTKKANSHFWKSSWTLRSLNARGEMSRVYIRKPELALLKVFVPKHE